MKHKQLTPGRGRGSSFCLFRFLPGHGPGPSQVFPGVLRQGVAAQAQPDQPGPLEVFQELYGPATFFFPALLTANYTPAPDNPDRTYIQEAMDRYGMAETQLIERGGDSFGIFGLMGQDSHDCAPTSGFVLEDAVLAAERCV